MEGALDRIDRVRVGLADEVYERIVDALLQGRIAPGDRLIQDKLAAELDVSRTPVRDALLRLREEGVIEPSGRRGFVVRDVSPAEVHAIYQAREAIEGYAAAIVAEAGEPAMSHVRSELRAATRRQIKTARASYEANRRIHRAVVEATGNEHLLSFFDAIWGRAMAGLIYHDFYSAEPYTGFVEEHVELVATIARSSGPAALAAMVEHIRLGFERTVRDAHTRRTAVDGKPAKGRSATTRG
jgi:DNA-binding GntR family transcriptional regulator